MPNRVTISVANGLGNEPESQAGHRQEITWVRRLGFDLASDGAMGTTIADQRPVGEFANIVAHQA